MTSKTMRERSEQVSRIHSFSNDGMGDHDAVALAELIKTNSISSEEITTAAVQRAKSVNQHCNAIVSESFESAIAASRKNTSGIFAGVPTFIKDTDDIIGSPTTVGSNAVPDKIATEDSNLVKQFKALGFINLGKSSTPEFGLTGTTEPVRFGPARNPWNTNHSTGGSSGGAAALVASGVVPIAHANDGAGSIRIPASCCGLVGLKPTRNRLAAVEASRFMPLNILHQGIVTRSVRDTAAFYSGIESVGMANTALPKIGNVTGPGKKRLKIALLTEASATEVSSDCVQAAHHAARICEDLGHTVEPVKMPFNEQVLEDFFIYWAEMAFAIKHLGRWVIDRKFDKSKLEPLAHGLSKEFLKNIHRFPMIVYRLKKFSQVYAKFFDGYDILLTPTLGHAPPSIGYLSTEENFEIAFERIKTFLPFTPYQNISGAPAITLPIENNSEDLPIGVQFATRYGEDRLLLELAFELEQVNPWKKITD